MTIEEKILKKVRLRKKPNETWVSFLTRVVKFIQKTHNDDDFKKWSVPHLLWYMKAIEYLKNHKDLLGFVDEKYIESDELSGQKSSARNRILNKSRKNKAAGYRLKELMLEIGMDASEDRLYAILLEEGYEFSKSSIHIIRTEFRRACLILNDKGYLDHLPDGIGP